MQHTTERSSRIDRTITLKFDGSDEPHAEVSVQRWSQSFHLCCRVQGGGFVNVPLSVAAAQDLAAALLELAATFAPEKTP